MLAPFTQPHATFTHENVTGRVQICILSRPCLHSTHKLSSLHIPLARFYTLTFQCAVFTPAHPSAWSSSRPIYTCKTIRNHLYINTHQPLVCICINSHMYMQQAVLTHTHTHRCFYLRFWEAKLPVPLHLGIAKYFFHYIWENIHKIRKNKAIFGLGQPPVTGGKTGQIKSLHTHTLTHTHIMSLFTHVQAACPI